MNEFNTKRNLIVNYLPTTLNQEDINKLFLRVGTVTKCKLVRNMQTGQSMGYAFIEYENEIRAANAIKQINGIMINGKTLKVSYARPSTQETKNTNVYIASLPLTVTEANLCDLFSPFGTVITNKLLTNPDGSSRGAGFIRYATNSEALAAISAMAGKTLPESNGPLTVKLAIPPKQIIDSDLSTTVRTSNVRYNPLAIPQNMNTVPVNQNLGLLVNQNANQFQIATNPNDRNINQVTSMSMNPTLNTTMVMPMGTDSASLLTCVYVYGLQPDHTELTLYQLFSPFGAILNVKLVRDLTKEEKPCKGYGFINFTQFEDAQKAVVSLNNVPLEGKLLQVSFKNTKNYSGVKNISLNSIGMVPVAT